jgi:hypothetical protein
MNKEKTSEDVKNTHVHGSTELILWNDYTTKSHVHIQHNTHQNPNDILHRNRKSNYKIHIETQMITEAILTKKSNASGIEDLKLYYQSILQRPYGPGTKTDT